MREQLIQYVNGLFANAPQSGRTFELHDELLQNTLDRYDDALSEGKSEQEAYAAAVSAIGDIDALLGTRRRWMNAPHAIAIALYILCVIPPIIGDAVGGIGHALGPSLMFVLAAVATCLILWPTDGNQYKKLMATGIGMYVLCVIPPILFDEMSSAVGDALGASLMFVIVAIATVLVVYASGRIKKPAAKAAARPAAPAREPEPANYRTAKALYWVGAVGVYAVLTSLSYWYYAWLIFPFAAALGSLIQGCVLLSKGRQGAYDLCCGLLWLGVCAAYLTLTIVTGRWAITWLVFPIGGLLNGMLSGIFAMMKGESR